MRLNFNQLLSYMVLFKVFLFKIFIKHEWKNISKQLNTITSFFFIEFD